MGGLTWQLAGFLVGLTYESIPETARDSARRCILDSVGSMIYGRYSPVGAQALEHVRRVMPAAEQSQVTAPGGDLLPVESAAFVSTVMARSSDLDDGHRYAMGHPGSFLVPAVLNYGQALGKNGKEMLTALVAGYEVYIRVGETINPASYRERGFESTSVTGSVSCAAALGKLFGLNREEMKNALGLAASFTGGLIEYQNDGTQGKVLGGVWAISTGLRAVQLAQSGFTGPEEAIEGKRGFAQAFSSEPRPERAVEDLGTEFKISEVYFKAHACMRGLHAAVDAMLALREQYGLTPETVNSVTVRTTPFVGRLSKPSPSTVVAAQSSLEFVLAVALEQGHIAGEEVLVEAMDRPQVLRTAQKVHLVMDSAVEEYVQKNPSHWGAVNLVIQTEDGHICEKFVPLPLGEAENPFSWEQLAGKFARMTKETPYEPYAGALSGQIAAFERLDTPARLYRPWD